MQAWGLTGIMGAGKSAARAHLLYRGYPVGDADQASRGIWEASYPRRAELIASFTERLGPSAIGADGILRRDVMRARLLLEPDLRPWLEAETHPHILAILRGLADAARASGAKAFFVEGTRLIESGYRADLDGIIAVTAPLELCLERVRARGGMSEAEARALISTQDAARMSAAADVVWENNGPIEALHRLIDGFLKQRGLA